MSLHQHSNTYNPPHTTAEVFLCFVSCCFVGVCTVISVSCIFLRLKTQINMKTETSKVIRERDSWRKQTVGIFMFLLQFQISSVTADFCSLKRFFPVHTSNRKTVFANVSRLLVEHHFEGSGCCFSVCGRPRCRQKEISFTFICIWSDISMSWL